MKTNTVDNIQYIIDHTANGWETAVRLILIRQIKRHRDISTAQLAAELGVSESWVDRFLGGRAARKSRDFHAGLDRIEAGITSICDKRGFMCACTDAGRAELRGILSMSGLTLGEEAA